MHDQVKCSDIYRSAAVATVQNSLSQGHQATYQMHVINSSCGIKDVLLAYTTANALTVHAGNQTKACGKSIGVSRKGYPRDGLDNEYKNQQDSHEHCPEQSLSP